MCLAVPMRLVKIDGQRGMVELNGVRLEIMLTLVPQARQDDYVIVHAGYALSVLDEAAARETLSLWNELETSAS